MNSKQKTGIALMAIVFGLAISPALSNEADARVTLPDAIIQDDLTAPKGDKPFGGVNSGNFYVHVKDDVTTIYAELDQRPSTGTVYEGWLVDADSGEKTSFGKFQEYRQVHLLATIDTQFNNDLIVITEEPLADSDPAPHTPVAGAVLGNPYGQ